MKQHLVFVALSGALGLSGNAWAMQDLQTSQSVIPSVIPSDLPAELFSPVEAKAELLPIEVMLNETKLVTSNVLRTVKGPAITVQELTLARITYQGNAFEYEKQSWVLLTQIPHAKTSFESNAARIDVKMDVQHLSVQKSDDATVNRAAPSYTPALISNYDWSSSRFSHPGQHSTATSIAFEHIASFGAMRLIQSWAANTGSETSAVKLSRVDSVFQYDDLDAARTWWAGDHFTSSQTWGHAYRLFGFGVQSNFDGRPELRVLPRPAVSGLLVEPSSYELFLDNKKIGNGQFESGKFEINQLPAVSSNGDVRVVFKDALGREQVRTLSFFIAPRQLAEGMTDYQLNVGKLRTGLLGTAADYGDWVVSGELGRGISDVWTLRAASELGKNQANIGLRQVLSVWGRGALTMDTAMSKNHSANGWFVAAQSQWSVNGMRLTLAAEKRSKDFWRIGDNVTDTNTHREAGVSAAVGFALGDIGNIGVAAAIEKRFDGTSVRNISASYSKQLSKQAFINVNANAYTGANKSKSVSVIFMYSFDDPAVRVTSTAQNTDAGTDYAVNVSRDASADFPVTLSASLGQGISAQHRSALGLSWSADVTSLNFNVNKTSSSTGVQTHVFANGSGSVTATAHGIFPSARIYDSAILVEMPGSPNVRTHIGGRTVKTNGAGYALVPHATGYATSQAMFEPSDLPLEVGASSQIAQVTAWPKGVATVKFDIVNTEGESFQVLDVNKQPLKVGSEVLLAEENQYIGRDGYFYLTSRAKGIEVKIRTPELTVCTANLPERKAGQARSEPIAVICE